MIDWFIVLTPILLVPIALLFFFVGCASAYPDDMFEINCYLENIRLSHQLEIRIFDSGTEIYGKPTDIDKVLQGGVGTSRVRFRVVRSVGAGPATLSCQVIDRTTDDRLIDGGATCEHDLEPGETYLFVFNAGVSDDGLEPCKVFEDCTPWER